MNLAANRVVQQPITAGLGRKAQPHRCEPRPLAWGHRWRHSARTAVTVTAGARDPYDLLGLPRTASVQDIKKAFRKRALKLHPDVNKAPDARERFMEAKQAYQQLLDEREGRGRPRGGTSAGPDARSSASSGSSSWGNGGYGQASQQQQRRSYQPEETYSFGDLLRDLDKELSDYARQRQQRRAGASGGASSATGAPKSLWEELFDIGEEFVEFLEQGLGVSDDEAASYGAFKKKYGDLSGDARGASSSTAGASSSAASSPPGGSSKTAAAPGPTLERKPTAEYVEDELQALKRKLGKQ